MELGGLLLRHPWKFLLLVILGAGIGFLTKLFNNPGIEQAYLVLIYKVGILVD